MSEVRATAASGAQKGRKPETLSLIPTPALMEIARVYGFGGEKYTNHNWRYGHPWSWSLDALLRHVLAFVDGEDVDPESGLHHLAHAAFHCNTIITAGIEHPELDDRWSTVKENPRGPIAE